MLVICRFPGDQVVGSQFTVVNLTDGLFVVGKFDSGQLEIVNCRWSIVL